MTDDDCRHLDECDGCAHLFATCAADGCGSYDVAAFLVPLGRAAYARLLLCDAHSRFHPRYGTPPFGLTG